MKTTSYLERTLRWVKNSKRLVLDSCYARKNYRAFLQTNETAILGDLPYDKDVVAAEFSDYGYQPLPYQIDVEKYQNYLRAAQYPDSYCVNEFAKYLPEKTLEHFLSLQFSSLGSQSIVVDVANAYSPFPSVVNRLFGCKVFSNDLSFPEGITELSPWHSRIGGNACNLPLGDNSCDLIVLHCALEMFERDNDVNLLKTVPRILRKNGKLVVVPLYMNTTYHILRDTKTPRRVLPEIDEGAKLVYRENFHGAAFARFYSVKALHKRLITASNALNFTVYLVTNAQEVDQNCYVSWIGVFEKSAPNCAEE